MQVAEQIDADGLGWGGASGCQQSVARQTALHVNLEKLLVLALARLLHAVFSCGRELSAAAHRAR